MDGSLEDTPPLPPVPAVPPINENEKVFKNGDVTLILYSDKPYDLSTLEFDTAICYIYAETVSLTTNKKFPEKTLGIYCNSFVLGSKNVTIDVSGADGDSGEVNEKAVDGHAGGSINLYAETMTNEILHNLTLLANGGNGGEGKGTKVDKEIGGRGGNGGDGGNRSVIFGSDASKIGMEISLQKKTTWPAQVQDYLNKVKPALATAVGYTAPQTSSWNIIAGKYATYSTSLSSLKSQLAALVAPPTNTTQGIPNEENKSKAGLLATAVQTVLDAISTSPVEFLFQKELDKVTDAALKLMKFGTSAMQKSLTSAFDAVDIPALLDNLQPSSPLTDMFGDVLKTSSSILSDTVTHLQHFTSSVSPGDRKSTRLNSSH